MQKNILYTALVTVLILLVPLLLQLTIGTGVDGQGLNWTLADFMVMGILIFGTGLLIDLARRNMGKYRALGIAFAMLFFLWLWAELAVGLFTNWGS